ncbi:hypothetical protein ACWF82_26995 [Nocardia sp. NPDC055053]
MSAEGRLPCSVSLSRRELVFPRIRAALDSSADPVERVDRAMETFLDICTEPAYRHIVLLQGPIALGWRRWREVDQRHLSGLVIDGAQHLLDAGHIQPHPPELLASAFYGALTEMSLTIAESADPTLGRARAAELARALLGGLITDTAHTDTSTKTRPS